MKKIFKIAGITLGIIILLLLVSPFLFKGSLESLLKKNLNKNLNAQVQWESLDISLFKSFPKAAVTLTNFSIVNNAPFVGDTLASGTSLTLDMGLKQLFKKENESIAVDQLILDEGLIRIKVDSLGNNNYDIAIQSDTNNPTSTSETENNGFNFNLSHYELNNSRIHYLDQSSQTFLELNEVNHQGTGDLSAALTTLSTQTTAMASLKLGDTQYLKEHAITLVADFELDIENQKYTFLENEAKINELPLTFNGYVQPKEQETQIAIDFRTPNSDFKNFLAVIPKKYVKNLDGVTTTGDFNINGTINGVASDTHIPMMDIAINSNNASFKYPNLPKTVRNITLDIKLKNETGLVQDTYLKIGDLTFKIDDRLFNANGSILHLTENMLVDLALKGSLDLANIEDVFPLDLEQPLSGVFKADIATRFDMNSVEKEQYDQIKTNGTASLSDFNYTDPSFTNSIHIEKANIAMSPGNIKLKELQATTGETDIAATGNIQNLIPWLMAKQDLKGRFNVQSDVFKVDDFMTTDAEETLNAEARTTANEAIKLPDFLDATLDFNAKKVIYDNVSLAQTTGTVRIADETAQLTNVSSKAFGGDVAFSGQVNTKEVTPTFNMNLDLQKVDIDESFGQLAMLKYIAPIAKALDGNLNTTLNLSGNLTENLTPDLTSLVGIAVAQILTAQVDSGKTPLLSKLGEQVTFLNLDQLSLKDVSTAVDFKDGNIVVQPFTFKHQDIAITASGSHGLDKSVNYNIAMYVPAKYLGGDVNKLLAKLDPAESDNMTVALPVGVSGSLTDPKIKVDTKAAVTELTQTLIAKQKEDLTKKGTDILKDIIGGGTTATDSTTTETETTVQDQTTEVVKDILGGIFGGKKKKKKADSTKTGN